MFNKLDIDKVVKELNRKTYIYEGDNHVYILNTGKNTYSVSKEEIDGLKVLFEVEGYDYEIIPFKYTKYKKIFEKYEKNGELWFFEWFFVGSPSKVELFDFKTRKTTDKNWTTEMITAAKMYKYTTHYNEKPREWSEWSIY